MCVCMCVCVRMHIKNDLGGGKALSNLLES